ncbi:MAG: pyruvate kinase [Calditrichia bacterium]
MSKKEFKIISTLGPKSLTDAFIKKCDDIRQLHFRLNGSHLSAEEINYFVKFVKGKLPGRTIDFYLDLQGNKLRIGDLPKTLILAPMQMVELRSGEKAEFPQIPLPVPQIFENAESGDVLLLQDATVKLEIINAEPEKITARVLEGRELRSHCGISLRTKAIPGGADDAKKHRQISVAKQLQISHLAMSYVFDAGEINKLRNECSNMDYHPVIIAKIEHPRALTNPVEICRASDEIWFCRGDLGSFIPLRELGYWQQKTVQIAKNLGKAVVIAGQVFHHLTAHSQPTRSEVVHFYDIQKQGASGIVLSDETAIGIDPVNVIKSIHPLLL